MTAINSDPCPGPCNRDWRQNRTKPGVEIASVPGDPVWCEPDRRRIRRALGDLPALHLALEADMAARTRLADFGSIRGSSGHPTPSPQVDLQDELLRHLQWIEDEIRAARPGVAPRDARKARPRPSAGRWAVETLPPGILGPPRLLDATTARERTPVTAHVARPADRALISTIAFITAHLDWLLDREDPGRWAGLRITGLHAKLRAATATGTGVSRRTQRCPRCRAKTLVQEPGSDYIQCEDCGRLVSLDEYADLCAPEKQEAAS